MQYMGGKERIAAQIAEIINTALHNWNLSAYYEPFCGSCAVSARVRTNKPMHLSDAHPYLIAMWQALQAGWRPPTEVSEAEYARVKTNKDENPALTGFVGFGCSFGGKWFGGYARGVNGNYAQLAHNGLLRRLPHLQTARFVATDYTHTQTDNALVYCDPPYAARTGYAGNASFDSVAFWRWTQAQARRNIVLVSEYACPVSHSVLWQRTFKQTAGNKPEKERVTENLYMVFPQ